MGMPRDPFSHFRKALSKKDKEAFDRLMERASMSKEGKVKVYRIGELEVQSIDPVEAMFLSMLMEHEKEIIELRERSKDRIQGGGK